eukprot:Nk52_evm4s360 gene=Nk52_evmTU4s360
MSQLDQAYGTSSYAMILAAKREISALTGRLLKDDKLSPGASQKLTQEAREKIEKKIEELENALENFSREFNQRQRTKKILLGFAVLVSIGLLLGRYYYNEEIEKLLRSFFE